MPQELHGRPIRGALVGSLAMHAGLLTWLACLGTPPNDDRTGVENPVAIAVELISHAPEPPPRPALPLTEPRTTELETKKAVLSASEPAVVAATTPPPRDPLESPQKSPKRSPKKIGIEPSPRPALKSARAEPRRHDARAFEPAAPAGTASASGHDQETLPATLLPAPAEPGSEPARYERIVLSLLERAKRFPESAKARGARGTAVVTFSLGHNGELARVALLRSSGEADLDAESLALVGRASPFPPPPPGARRSFAIDIGFGIRIGT